MIIYQSDVDIKEYHPRTVASSKEFIELANTENKELKLLADVMQFILDNYYIQTLRGYGVEQWEQILNLIPYTDDTTEQRREVIEVTLKSQLPYTYRQLENILTGLCGEGGYQIDLDSNNYFITVLVSLGSKRAREIVETTLQKILPMNLNYKVDLLYNRHIDLERFTHERLNAFTYEEIKEEVLPNE